MTQQKNIKLPKKGLTKQEVISRLKEAKKEDLEWQLGKSFCLIYYPGKEKSDLVREAYNTFFTENALNPLSFPSLSNFESEVVRMVSGLFNGDKSCSGTMTSGGTESILMAVKTARDYSEKHYPEIKKPEVILPSTAHPAFNKACHYFKVNPVIVPVKEDFKADTKAIESSITKNTIMLVASAPAYPHGVIDPVEEIANLALKRNLLCHVDACIGSFMLPFIERLGYKVPLFDFRINGVTSISADLHKYGYAAKGASVILYKTPELKKTQFYVYTSWPGGIYGSPAIAGSKPGGTIAAAWAALMGIGENGYMELAEVTMQTTEKLRKGIMEIPELYILGEPQMSILSFSSKKVNIYEVADELNIKGWHFERLQQPAAIHLTVSQIHSGVVDAFLQDLRKAVTKAQKTNIRSFTSNIQIATTKRLVKVLPSGVLAKIQGQFSGRGPAKNQRTAPMYGMMGALSGTEDLDEIVRDLLEKLNK